MKTHRAQLHSLSVLISIVFLLYIHLSLFFPEGWNLCIPPSPKVISFYSTILYPFLGRYFSLGSDLSLHSKFCIKILPLEPVKPVFYMQVSSHGIIHVNLLLNLMSPIYIGGIYGQPGWLKKNSLWHLWGVREFHLKEVATSSTWGWGKKLIIALKNQTSLELPNSPFS